MKRTRQDAPKLIDVTGSVGKWTRAGGDPPNLQECQSATQRQEQMFQEAKDNVRKTARTQKTAWREEELPQKLKVKVEEVSEGKESENGEDVSAGKESKNGEESEDFLDDQESSQTDERQAEPVFCSLEEFGKRLSRKTQGERKSSDRSSMSRLRKRLTSSHMHGEEETTSPVETQSIDDQSIDQGIPE